MMISIWSAIDMIPCGFVGREYFMNSGKKIDRLGKHEWVNTNKSWWDRFVERLARASKTSSKAGCSR
jgi:hypothetical protein